MIQLTLTPNQLVIIKDALESFDESCLSAQETKELKDLIEYIKVKLSSTNI